MKTRLSVNVDHDATVRQARRAAYPDPVEAAAVAEAAGAAGITVHLRGDRRHIQDGDVARLREAVRGKLNLEMAAEDEMLAAAERLRPHQATLVPERPEEVTTEGGLDLLAHGERIDRAARRLADAGISVSLFLDPDPRQIEAAARLGVTAVELHTGKYALAKGMARKNELEALIAAGRQIVEAGMRLHAGHGLNYQNVQPVGRIDRMFELNIGHAIVSRAVLVGMERAVREMKQLLNPQR